MSRCDEVVVAAAVGKNWIGLSRGPDAASMAIESSAEFLKNLARHLGRLSQLGIQECIHCATLPVETVGTDRHEPTETCHASESAGDHNGGDGPRMSGWQANRPRALRFQRVAVTGRVSQIGGLRGHVYSGRFDALGRELGLHSERSATIGSTRTARSTGTMLATKAAAISASATPHVVSRSNRVTPNSRGEHPTHGIRRRTERQSQTDFARAPLNAIGNHAVHAPCRQHECEEPECRDQGQRECPLRNR